MKLNNNTTIQQYNNCKSRGFTLIELLVAISIIGILSSFLLANFVGVRQRARDGVRKSDLRQIQSALELYRSDKGKYPDNVPNSTKNDCLTSLLSEPDNCSSIVYMKKVPVDPLTKNGYRYAPSPSTNPNTYGIIACLENVKDTEQPDTRRNIRPCDGEKNIAYIVSSP